PSKKGILGLLTDARGERRKRAGVNPINGFLLGCIEKAGKVCSSIEEVIEQLLVWSEELKKEESGRKR
ncbi:MAG: hypothetical protein FJY85_14745, partial [Deltaproteobacteria bacterium]|nr:hypothetical protein [Deltaproteobacteria bacterium]